MQHGEILMIDDSYEDARLVAEALRSIAPEVLLGVASSGSMALRRLRQQPRPNLILLDLNLIGESGHDILAQIKSEPAAAGIPVIVLSSSARDEDVDRAYSGHASCYITKPQGLQGLLSLAEILVGFWFRTATLPRATVVEIEAT